MINKYMKQLYKEVEQVRRKLLSGKMKYFESFGKAMSYTVVLKDGSFFEIALGTKTVPKVRKKSIAYINKKLMYDSLDREYKLGYRGIIDTDNGLVRFTKTDTYAMSDYVIDRLNKHRYDVFRNIDTGSWD